MRYEVRIIADPECTLITPAVLFNTDNLFEAKQSANLTSPQFCYGTAIADNETGQVDWGFGFGVPVPDPEN